jgi:hypothetical protein
LTERSAGLFDLHYEVAGPKRFALRLPGARRLAVVEDTKSNRSLDLVERLADLVRLDGTFDKLHLPLL